MTQAPQTRTAPLVAGAALTLAWAAQIALAAGFGGDALLAGASVAAVAFFALLWRGISRLGRGFLLAIPTLGAVAMLSGDDAGVLVEAARSGLLMVAFVGAMSTLRIAASASGLLRRTGAHLLAQPPGRAYAILNAGAMLAASVLLFGVINLFGAMIAQAAAGETGGKPARRAMSAVLRGYAMMPVWSPIALPFGLIAVNYPQADWLALLPMAAVAVAMLALVGLWADRRDFPAAPAAGPAATPLWNLDILALGALVAGLMALVGGVAATTGWPVIRTVVLVVPVAALIWFAVAEARTRSLGAGMAEGLSAEVSILAVMAGAGAGGVLLGALLPVEAVSDALRAAPLPGWAVPPLIVALFLGLGQVGFSPTLTFITLAVILPDPSLLDVPPEVYFGTILGIWGLASIATPFSVPALVTARLFGTSSADVAYRWSPRYLIAAPLAVAALFTALAALT